jgi:hypothetical protein
MVFCLRMTAAGLNAGREEISLTVDPGFQPREIGAIEQGKLMSF